MANFKEYEGEKRAISKRNHPPLRLTLKTEVILILSVLTIIDLHCGNGGLVKAEVPSSEGAMPQHIHISFGKTAQDIVIMWSTKDKVLGQVEFSMIGNQYSLKHPGTVESQNATLVDDSEKALRNLHRAELKGMQPGQQFQYRVVSILSDSLKVKSDDFAFTVPRLKDEHSFMIFADMGLSSKSLQFIVHEAVNQHYDALFHVGDIAYNLNADSGAIGDRYMDKIQHMTANVPYMTTPGDHERFGNFYHYRHRFSMPGIPWPMPVESLYYSIDIGLVHFVSINTEAFMKSHKDKQENHKWLVSDLVKANENRQKVPWIVVMGHKPIYCSASVMEQECHKEYSSLRDSLDDVFYSQGVDLYISGHKHCYERMWPMYRGQAFQTDNVNPMAPIHIVFGAMGYEYLTDSQMSKPYWLAFASSDQQKELFARLMVHNRTHLTWQVLAAHSNEELEKVQIIQNKHGSFGALGEAAFEKLILLHSRQNGESHGLPPEPFHIIDEPSTNSMVRHRKNMLYVAVVVLGLLILLILRHGRVRRLFKR